MSIPKRRKAPKMVVQDRGPLRSPAHRQWIRGNHCATGSQCISPIEAAHVRTDTNCGIGMKPGDEWIIPLCLRHHAEQHNIGERGFERKYNIDMKEIAAALARKSPHLMVVDGEIVKREKK